MRRPPLSIVIVSWNTRRLLLDCLESLSRQALDDPLEIVVVDNASTDGSAEAVREAFPAVRLVQNPGNLGFAAASNRGVHTVRGAYVLLLNSDTLLPEPDLLRRWLAFMDGNPRASASGCRLTYPDGRHQVGDAGFRPTTRSVLNHAFFLSRLSPRRFPGLYLSGVRAGEPFEVDWICGAGLLIRRSALDDVGPLDERFFMFAEDIEWGCRARARGHRVFYLPALRIVHLQGASAAQRESAFGAMWLRNLGRLYAAYQPRQPRLFFRALMAAGFALRIGLHAPAYLLRGDAHAGARIRRLSGYLRLALSDSAA